MIDSHCHLVDPKFDDDINEVLLRAEEHGIEMMMCISDSLEEASKCVDLAEKNEQIFCTVGVHPHNAKDWNDTSENTLNSLVHSSLKIKAVGEIGLDYHYDNSPREQQKSVFRLQLRIAKELDLPVVIHNRESIDDLMEIIQDVRPQKAVLHCCTEKWEHVQQWLDLGYFVSFTGIATYPKSNEIRDVIRQCPMDRMMIETDAPYLAPVPHRGKRNEPAFVREVAKVIAQVKKVDLAQVDIQTTKNAIEFFGL